VTIKMISSTSTTSTSGVTLMDACILEVSPSRIRVLLRVCGRLGDAVDLRRFEEAIHELSGSPIHLDVKIFNPAREVVERSDGRNGHEDAQRRGDQRFSDAARNYRHTAGPSGRDVSKSVDDAGYGTEKTDERCCRADCSQEPKTLFQF